MSNGWGLTGGQWERHHAIAARVAKVALLVVLACNLALLMGYVFVGYFEYFHSDSAAKSLLAQEIYEAGSYFPRDWTYVNGDLMVVFGQLFILPFLPFAENGYLLHAISGAVTSLLVLWGTWLVASIAVRSVWIRLLCVAIVASGLSLQVTENLFGQGSYGAVFYLACFQVYLAWRFMQAEGRSNWLWGALLAGLVVLAFWSNTQRAAASYALPLLSAIAVDVLYRAWNSGFHVDRRLRKSIILAGIILGAGLLGAVLHAAVLARVDNIQGAGLARWLSPVEMTRNLGFTLQGILEILGAMPPAGGDVVGVAGAYQAVRFIAGLVLVPLMGVALAAGIRNPQPGYRFLAAFAAASTGLFCFLQATTTIPDMSNPAFSSRYLVPSVVLSLLVVVAHTFDHNARPLFRVTGVLVSLMLLMSMVSPENPMAHPKIHRPDTPKTAVVRWLEQQGLRYGYGSYWNAGAMTVMSDSRVKVRQIQIVRGLPRPMFHLSSERWYRPSAWSGKTFLVLTDEELAALDMPLLTSLVGEEVQREKIGGFNVLVFPRNPADALAGWDDELRRPLRLTPSPMSMHNVGELVEPANGAAMLVSKGAGGFLHFGPYLKLEDGPYSATFDIEVVGAPRPGVAHLDVVVNSGADVRASGAPARAGRQRVTLPFDLTSDVSDLEVRVLTDGSSELRLYGIQLQRRNAVASKPPKP
ncbi:hypothetical protein [Lysobacter sp.]|uniref:hypothetical protein n=1 Tax=Lysobacter sp. TaxID=72226 RepID=UPI002D242930|nr:hypothetical protein [Lysobacter sp.]HZX78326.1 hypothetical protein [Lysobacter sp.]